MSKETKAFVQGFAAACATLIRTFDEPTMASEILKMNGFKRADLVDASVDEFDLNILFPKDKDGR